MARMWTKLPIILLLAIFLAGADAKKCPADETRSLNDPNNLYDCPKEASCCFENGLPSCCQPKEMNEAVKDQLKLWGGLAAVLVVIVIVVLSCRNDIEVCREGTVCCPCCCKPKHVDEEDQKAIISDNRARIMGPPDFTAPGTVKRTPPHHDDVGHLHEAPLVAPKPAPMPPHQQVPAIANAGPLPEPPKTAGFAPIMDMADDDDDFRF